jgi:MFS family permease
MRNRRENLFFAVVGLFWFAQYIYLPFLSPHMVVLGISASLVGFISGVYGFSQMVLRIPLSVGGSLTGSHKLIICGGLISVIISCALPLISDAWIFFFLSRLLAGASSSTWVSFSAYLLEGAEKQANRRMGYLMAAQSAGMCLAQLTGTVFYERSGINTLFIIGAAAALTGIALLGFTPFHNMGRADKRERVWDAKAFTGALKNKNLWLCAMLMSVGQYVIFATNFTFSGVFAQEALHADALRLGLIALVFQAAALLTSLVMGKLGGKPLRERAILVCGFLGFAVYCVLTALCATANLLVILQILGGICFALLNVLLFANAGRELTDKQQIFSMGIFQSLYSIGMTLGPAVSGLVFEHMGGSYLATFGHMAVIAAAGALWTFISYRNPTSLTPHLPDRSS